MEKLEFKIEIFKHENSKKGTAKISNNGNLHVFVTSLVEIAEIDPDIFSFISTVFFEACDRLGKNPVEMVAEMVKLRDEVIANQSNPKP